MIDRWRNVSFSILLGCAIIGCIAAIIYFTSNPGPNDKFTEFYLLGPDGSINSYPRQIKLGENTTVILGIVNHEYEKMTYRFSIVMEGTQIEDMSILMAANERWEHTINIKPLTEGYNKKVEFALYKTSKLEPYITLHLWLDIIK